MYYMCVLNSLHLLRSKLSTSKVSKFVLYEIILLWSKSLKELRYGKKVFLQFFKELKNKLNKNFNLGFLPHGMIKFGQNRWRRSENKAELMLFTLIFIRIVWVCGWHGTSIDLTGSTLFSRSPLSTLPMKALLMLSWGEPAWPQLVRGCAEMRGVQTNAKSTSRRILHLKTKIESICDFCKISFIAIILLDKQISDYLMSIDLLWTLKRTVFAIAFRINSFSI